MEDVEKFCVRLLHCGNKNLANPADVSQKNIFFMPMGLVALADVLDKAGVDVEVIHSDLEFGQPIEKILDFDHIDAVGFDCHWLNQSLAVLDTARLIKKIKPTVFVFLGGYTASLYADEIISRHPQVDAVIRGDAEIPIVALCNARQGKISMNEVPNLVWKDEKDRLVKNDFSYTAASEELSKLDFSAFHLLRNADYYRYAARFWTGYKPIADSTFFILELGRGCEYACTFCGGNCEAQQRMNKRRKTIFRSIDSIIATIKNALAMGFGTFYVCLEFTGSEAWYLQLFQRIRQEKLTMNWIYGSWGVPSNDMLDALSETFPHTLIEISPETGSLELRRKNKDARICYTNQQLEDAIAHARSKGNIMIQVYFGYYLEGDSPASIWGSVAYALHLAMLFPSLMEIQFANFSTDPGSLFVMYPERFQMDIAVRHLSDFLKYLKRNFLEKQGENADMTLHRPISMTPVEDFELRRKMRLLSDLFLYYRRSVSYILQKTGDPAVLVAFLKEAREPLNGGFLYSPSEIKELLSRYCSQLDISSETVTYLACQEEQKVESILKGTLNLPRIFMAEDFGNIPEVEVKMIADTGTAEQNLGSVDFDF